MSDDKTAGLDQARKERSLRKRRAVEKALSDLKDRNETITFKAVALAAGVSRQYLYNNFRDSINSERKTGRQSSNTIEGVVVPSRTPDEARHIEALLKNKLERMKADLTSARRENARLKQALEKERGRSEHFRQNWVNASSKR